MGVRGLEAALRERVDGQVRLDTGSRAAYATDASNFRQTPVGLVVPRTPEAAAEAVAVAREHGAPSCRGAAGPSFAGAVRQHGRGDRPVQVLHPAPVRRRGRPHLRPPARHRAGRSQPPSCLDRPALRPRTRHPHELHDRRRDRLVVRPAGQLHRVQGPPCGGAGGVRRPGVHLAHLRRVRACGQSEPGLPGPLRVPVVRRRCARGPMGAPPARAKPRVGEAPATSAPERGSCGDAGSRQRPLPHHRGSGAGRDANAAPQPVAPAVLLATGLRPEPEAGSAYGVAPGTRPAPPGRLAKSLALTAAGAATALGRGFRRAK
jgi:hypothetical protein